MSNTETKKRSPNIDLRGAVGMYVVGTFEGRYESKNFPGKFNTLIKVEDTNSTTTIWDKDVPILDNKTGKEIGRGMSVEVDVEEGDNVFLAESTWLANIFEKYEKGTRFRLEYTGKGKPKKKGYKAAYEYKVEVL